MKCDTCINARAILSENGWHRVCNLSSKSALRCITGEKSQYTKFHEKENGKSSLPDTFIRLCDYLNVDPYEISIETETASMED